MRKAVNGISLGYDLAGSGPPVLFLHGFPLNRKMWRRQVEALGSAQTLTVDSRGFGESDASPSSYSLETLADDAVALARSHGITRAIVVGLSMGGYVAFRVLERAPEFVAGLVLADTRAEPDTPEGREKRLGLAAQVKERGLDALQDFIAGLTGPTTLDSRPDVLSATRQMIGHPESGALAAALEAIAHRPDSRPLLSTVSVPTLVLVGEEDALTPPASAQVMADGIGGSRLVILPKAGHLSNLETPDAFNRELTTFVAGAGGRG